MSDNATQARTAREMRAAHLLTIAAMMHYDMADIPVGLSHGKLVAFEYKFQGRKYRAFICEVEE